MSSRSRLSAACIISTDVTAELSLNATVHTENARMTVLCVDSSAAKVRFLGKLTFTSGIRMIGKDSPYVSVPECFAAVWHHRTLFRYGASETCAVPGRVTLDGLYASRKKRDSPRNCCVDAVSTWDVEIERRGTDAMGRKIDDMTTVTLCPQRRGAGMIDV